MRRPRKPPASPVSDWEGNTAPKLNVKPIALEDYERRVLGSAIAPDASGFVLGTHYWLRAYPAGGGELWQKNCSRHSPMA